MERAGVPEGRAGSIMKKGGQDRGLGVWGVGGRREKEQERQRVAGLTSWVCDLSRHRGPRHQKGLHLI